MNIGENNLVCVRICNEDVYFEVASEEERKKILTDSSYAMQIYNTWKCLDTNKEDCEVAPEFLNSEPLNSSEETHTQVSELVSQDVEDFLWNDKTTLLLLEEYRTRKERFRSPKIKKRNLWQEIVAVFSEHKYSVTEDILDKKFRNLKQTFVRIRDNQNTKKRTGKGNISWKFYDIMCIIFSVDKTINMEVNTIESFLPLQGKAPTSATESLECQTSNSTSKLLKIGTSMCNISSIIQKESSSALKIANKKCQLDHIPVEDQNNNIDTIYNSTPNTTRTTKNKSRKGLMHYRQELIKTEKQRVGEISDLRKSIDDNNKLLKELVETAKERNKLLSKLVETERNRK